MKEESTKMVKIYQKPLKLQMNNSNGNLEGKLSLQNLTKNYIIFKVFNNAQKGSYSVKPSCSFIMPESTSEVLIKRHSTIFSKKEKLLFSFYAINQEVNDNNEVKNIFFSKDYEENTKQNEYVDVIFNNYKNNKESLLESTDNFLSSSTPFLYRSVNNERMNENLHERINEINQAEGEIRDNKNIKVNHYIQEGEKYCLNKKIKVPNFNIKIIIITMIILMGLVAGANLAKAYRNLFHLNNKKNNKYK